MRKEGRKGGRKKGEEVTVVTRRETEDDKDEEGRKVGRQEGEKQERGKVGGRNDRRRQGAQSAKHSKEKDMHIYFKKTERKGEIERENRR